MMVILKQQQCLESLKTNGSKLLEEGIRWFGLNPITGIPINRFIMVRGFKNSKVVDKYLVPWSDPAEPTHSTYFFLWQDQFASDWAAGLFRTIGQDNSLIMKKTLPIFLHNLLFDCMFF